MTRNETVKPVTCSFCAEPQLLDEVEQVREDHEKKAGHLSRSTVIRLLLRRGLDSVHDRGLLGEPGAAQ